MLGIYLASAVGTKLDDFTGGTVLPSASSYCQGKGWAANCVSRTYYSFSGANIAVREQSNVTNTLSWLYDDHPSASLRTCLGSASLMTQRMDNGSADAHPLSR